jgi:hypothetical protein
MQPPQGESAGAQHDAEPSELVKKVSFDGVSLT